MRLARFADVGRVPIPPLVELARTRYRRCEFWDIVNLPEPLFEATSGKSGAPPHGEALELLCDLHIALGHETKRDALLDRSLPPRPSRL